MAADTPSEVGIMSPVPGWVESWPWCPRGMVCGCAALVCGGMYTLLAVANVDASVRNRAVSSVAGAFICAMGVAVAMATQPELTDHGPWTPRAAFAAECVIGYFLYDTLIGLTWGFESGAATLVHHIAVVYGLSTGLYFGVWGRSMTTLLIADGTNPLLHISWYCRKTGKGPLKVVGATLLVAFFALRVVMPVHVLYQARPFEELAKDCDAAQLKTSSVPCTLTASLLALYIMFAGVNIFWFWKLISIAIDVASAKAAAKAD